MEKIKSDRIEIIKTIKKVDPGVDHWVEVLAIDKETGKYYILSGLAHIYPSALVSSSIEVIYPDEYEIKKEAHPYAVVGIVRVQDRIDKYIVIAADESHRDKVIERMKMMGQRFEEMYGPSVRLEKIEIYDLTNEEDLKKICSELTGLRKNRIYDVDRLIDICLSKLK